MALIVGTMGNDSLLGTNSSDDIFGLEGDDTVSGANGRDYYWSGPGNDVYVGQIGDLDSVVYRNDIGAVYVDLATGFALDSWGDTDTLVDIERVTGGDFDDTLLGTDASESFTGGLGDDTIDGRSGFDFVWMGRSQQGIYVDLAAGTATGNGVDTLISIEGFGGSNYSDTILGNSDDNLFFPDWEGDPFTPNSLVGGADLVDGRGGFDSVDYSVAVSGVEIDLSAGYGIDGNGNIDTLLNIEGVIGSNFDDRLLGNSDANWFEGNSGDDTIRAGSGADTVQAGAGNDEIALGAADGAADLIVLFNGFGDDIVTEFEAPVADGAGGFFASDMLDVSGMTDLLGNAINTLDVYVEDAGGEGRLRFYTGETLLLTGVSAALLTPQALAAIGIPLAASDGIVFGTAEDDLIDVSYLGDTDGDLIDNGDALLPGDAAEDDVVLAGDGSDTVFAGLGADEVSGGLGDDSVNGGDGADLLRGQGGADTLLGGAGNDSISGGEGHDSLTGGGDDDTLEGDRGDDTVTGGDGADSIEGGEGTDSLTGNAGADTIHGGLGADVIDGGSGGDWLFGGAENDSVFGAGGDDTLLGGAGADTLAGGNGDDSVTGGDGNDFLSGENGADMLDGGAGNDRIYGGADADSVYGRNGNDSLFGEGGDDLLVGEAGRDRLFGGEGNDTLRGGEGRDRLYGSSGDDHLSGGLGRDYLNGGSGFDIAYYDDMSSGVTVRLEGYSTRSWFFGRRNYEAGAVEDGERGDWFYSIEGVVGSAHADVIFGSSRANLLNGGGGNDYLNGRLGDDTLYGGQGNDGIAGSGGHDSLVGGDGDDRLYGDEGNDTLRGGSGADVLSGGEGSDHLYGGAGADVFRFSGYEVEAGRVYDYIWDFQDGIDTIAINHMGFTRGAQLGFAQTSYGVDVYQDGDRFLYIHGVTQSQISQADFDLSF